ncbi:hypothetical protein FE79_14895, partial [Staphylococcus aureus]
EHHPARARDDPGQQARVPVARQIDDGAGEHQRRAQEKRGSFAELLDHNSSRKRNQDAGRQIDTDQDAEPGII